MKYIMIKKPIEIAISILLLGCISLLVAACAPSSVSAGNKIASIMQKERDTNSTIHESDTVDKVEAFEGNYGFCDDLWEYVYSPDGHIVFANRTQDKTSDINNVTSENSGDLKVRALNLHKRNFTKLLKVDYSITDKMNPMGTRSIEIKELQNGHPTGRKTHVTFSKGGALISLVTYNKPVPDADLYRNDKLSMEQSAEIAFTEMFRKYGHVMENKSLAETLWTAEKETYQMRSVWIVDITIIRSDWDPVIKEWGARVWVDVFTGDILQTAYQA